MNFSQFISESQFTRRKRPSRGAANFAKPGKPIKVDKLTKYLEQMENGEDVLDEIRDLFKKNKAGFEIISKIVDLGREWYQANDKTKAFTNYKNFVMSNLNESSDKIQQELYNFQLTNDSEVSNVSITKDKLSVRYFQRHRKSAQDDKAFKELAKSVFGSKKYTIEYGDFENTAILE